MLVPNGAIKRLEIAFPQESIVIKAAPPNYAMGGPLTLLTSGLAEKKLRPALERADKEAPASYIRDELIRGVRENIDRNLFPNVGDIELASPANAGHLSRTSSPDCLYLSFEVYFTDNLRSLRIELKARAFGDGRKADSKPLFGQDLYYAVPAEPHRVFFSPTQGADYWQRQDETAIRRHIREGVNELVAMLNREVTRQPVKERIPGRQIAWDDGQLGTYGVILDEVGDRVWLRLRGGRLASIPRPRQ